MQVEVGVDVLMALAAWVAVAEVVTVQPTLGQELLELILQVAAVVAAAQLEVQVDPAS
jgi:hypothetical protein